MDYDLTPLEIAVFAMLGTFMPHENADGQITKKQFMRIMEGELPTLWARAQNRDSVLKSVDENEDELVDFEEFTKLLARFAKQNYEDIKELMKQAQQKAS